jgi:hypothetical protein
MQSRNRPGVARKVPGGLGSQISMTFATWRWWGRQPHAPANFTPQDVFVVFIFTRGWVDPRAMVRSEGNMELKNRVTLPGIEPRTVQLVAQHLKYYANPGPNGDNTDTKNRADNTHTSKGNRTSLCKSDKRPEPNTLRATDFWVTFE